MSLSFLSYNTFCDELICHYFIEISSLFLQGNMKIETADPSEMLTYLNLDHFFTFNKNI